MAQAPAVGPLPAVALPRATRFSLVDGLQVVRLRRDVAPIVSAAFMFRSGGACDPAGRTGLASIDRRDAGRGRGRARRAGHRRGAGAAGRRSVAGERARRLAAVDAGAARDVPRGDGDRRRRPDPAPAGRRPTGSACRTTGARASCSGAISPRRSSTWSPIGCCSATPTRTGSRSTGSNGRSTRSRSTTCAPFTRAHYRPNHASLVVAGDFDEATLQATAGERRWPPGSRGRRRPRRRRSRPGPARPRLVLVDRPGAPQSVVRLVAPGIDRFSPDRPGLSMLNAILGGSFTSRLNFNLREKHGLHLRRRVELLVPAPRRHLRGARRGLRRSRRRRPCARC